MESVAALKVYLEANEEGLVPDIQHEFLCLQDWKLTTRQAQCESKNKTFKPKSNKRRQHEADMSI